MKARIESMLTSFRKFASTHNYSEKPIFSIYLDLDPTKENNRKENPAWRIELSNQMREVKEGLDEEILKRYQSQESWKEFDQNLESYIQGYTTNQTGKSALILSDMDDFASLDIQLPVETTVHYGMPRVEHLVYTMDKYKKYLVLILSEAEIRAVEVFMGRVTGEQIIETNQEVRNRFGKKARTLAADRRDLETEENYAREIADELNSYFMDDPDFERLILAGNQKIAHNVKNKLHPSVKDVLVSIERMDVKTNEAEIADRISNIARGFEEEHDLMVIDDLVALNNRNGSAAVELTDVSKALENDQVKTLIVSYPLEDERKAELIYKAAMKGVSINFVFGEAKDKLDGMGGVGAFLYYS